MPLNKVQHVLGCSKTRAEVLVQHRLITSVTPIADDQIGQTWGQFNRDDLEAFKDEMFQDTRYGTACNLGNAPLTWTGRVASLDEWRTLKRHHITGEANVRALFYP